MKQKLTTTAKIKNISEYILLFGLLGYAATKLWNTANWLRRKAWEETGKIPNYNQQAPELKGNRWYKSLHSQTAQAILQELHRAYLSWFSLRKKGDKKARLPGFRPHAWPFRKLIQYITYKAAKYGISVELVNEAYTSQTCSNCGLLRKSNRIHRGLYVCKNCGTTINADVNGAKNILKKYLQREGIPEGVVGEVVNSSSSRRVARPLVNLFVQRKTELKSREQGTFLRKAA